MKQYHEEYYCMLNREKERNQVNGDLLTPLDQTNHDACFLLDFRYVSQYIFFRALKKKKPSWPYLCGSISGFSILFLFQYYSVLITITILYILKLVRVIPPILFFLNIVLALLWPVPLHITFRISLSILQKTHLAHILVGLMLNLEK